VDGAAALPERTRHPAFGDVAAVWSVIEREGVTHIIDEVVGLRRSGAAASVGTRLALAALNRLVTSPQSAQTPKVVKKARKLGLGGVVVVAARLPPALPLTRLQLDDGTSGELDRSWATTCPR
jgi:hypothetical protein